MGNCRGERRFRGFRHPPNPSAYRRSRHLSHRIFTPARALPSPSNRALLFFPRFPTHRFNGHPHPLSPLRVVSLRSAPLLSASTRFRYARRGPFRETDVCLPCTRQKGQNDSIEFVKQPTSSLSRIVSGSRRLAASHGVSSPFSLFNGSVYSYRLRVVCFSDAIAARFD